MAAARALQFLLASLAARPALPKALGLQEAMGACAGIHGASGVDFTSCLEAKAGRGAVDSNLEIVRNFSCAQDDTGSPIVRSLNLTVPAGYDACAATSAGAETATPHESVHPEFLHLPGYYLPAGDDLQSAPAMTATEAADACLRMPDCQGFTYTADAGDEPAHIFFKSNADGYQRGKGWHTYRRRQQPTCSAEPPEAETRTYKVDIVREEPLVAMIRGFTTPEECDMLVEAGGDWDSMGRAFTSQGKPSSYRRSYSKNIYPPLGDSDHKLMRLVARMFSTTRNLTGYNVYPPGQEPVNAVLYKDLGDEYRPHCDGTCTGEDYKNGERIATSILYCQTAELGGHTSFTEGTHKVVPLQGDMLLFAYRYSDGRMTGREAEHSGCPIRRGKKWIATQWYREGVAEHWSWQDVNAILRDI
mmetsp:Transcript_94574/g.282439  ORF Transcript_94574/g.282439 Transcript_94574/m.282439 type:complete len:417 (+) Transcript_94574:43-1293(+)